MPVVMAINLPRAVIPRGGPGLDEWGSCLMRDKVIIAFVLRRREGQGQSRATMVNLSSHALRGKAERCKHRLCLASLFGRRVVNGVGYVVLVCVCVCASAVVSRVCIHGQPCLFVFTFALAMLSCLQDKLNVFLLVNTISAFLITDVHQLIQGC